MVSGTAAKRACAKDIVVEFAGHTINDVGTFGPHIRTTPGDNVKMKVLSDQNSSSQ